MEHTQKIHFFAPQFVTTSFRVHGASGRKDGLETLITGTIKDTCEERRIENSWVEEFANCQISVEAIKRFTLRYGWLWASRAAKPASERFSVRLTQWMQARWQFRLAWDRVLGLPPREADLQGFPEESRRLLVDHHQQVRTVDGTGGKFELSPTWGMIFTADSLYHALLLKLLSLSESNRLRRCRRPDCDRFPYFIAEHAKQQYCSERCGAWGQQQLKKAWWDKHGEQWREKRSQAILSRMPRSEISKSEASRQESRTKSKVTPVSLRNSNREDEEIQTQNVRRRNVTHKAR